MDVSKNNLSIVCGTPKKIQIVNTNGDIIDLSNYKIHSIWIRTITHLHITKLNVHNNLLTFVPDIFTLRVLNCSDNLITELPTYMPLLEELDCSNNLITHIPKYRSIKKLICSNNPLTAIPKNVTTTATNCPIHVIHNDSTSWRKSGVIQNGRFVWITESPIESKYILINWQEAKTTVAFKSQRAKKLAKFLFYP